jgi:hypothetical protein
MARILYYNDALNDALTFYVPARVKARAVLILKAALDEKRQRSFPFHLHLLKNYGS